jgi:hypothetical protein
MLEVLINTPMEKELKEYEQGIEHIKSARLRQLSLKALRSQENADVDLRTLAQQKKNRALRGFIRQIRAAADLTVYHLASFPSFRSIQRKHLKFPCDDLCCITFTTINRSFSVLPTLNLKTRWRTHLM